MISEDTNSTLRVNRQLFDVDHWKCPHCFLRLEVDKALITISPETIIAIAVSEECRASYLENSSHKPPCVIPTSQWRGGDFQVPTGSQQRQLQSCNKHNDLLHNHSYFSVTSRTACKIRTARTRRRSLGLNGPQKFQRFANGELIVSSKRDFRSNRHVCPDLFLMPANRSGLNLCCPTRGDLILRQDARVLSRTRRTFSLCRQ
jgi:hypothetical protein